MKSLSTPDPSLLARAAVLACAWAAAAAVATPMAAAQPAGDAGRRDKAIAALKAGNRLLDARRPAEALARFQEAYELVPSPKLHFNLGQAYRDLGDRPLLAYQHFERFLAEVPDAAPASRAEAKDALALLRGSLAFLIVQTEPPGAEVSVDGEARGRAPLATAVVLAPGAHVVRAHLADHAAPAEETVTLAPGQEVTKVIRLSRPLPDPPAVARAQPPIAPAPLPAAREPDAVVDVTAARPEPDARPFYARPWTWAIAGAVVLGATIAVIAASSSGASSPACPANVSCLP